MRNVFAALLTTALLLSGAGAAGSGEQSLLSDSRTRHYRVHRPVGLDRAQATPLVVVLHGGFGTGRQAERSYRWDAMADARGFVVAYPEGYRRSWNAGGPCCGPAFREKVDDVGFLDNLIAKVSRSENIDPRRIYMTGISNGAAMAYRYACEGKIALAAIGSVAGTMLVACPHLRPLSVIEIHGLQDKNIPFAGGVGSKGVTDIDWPPVRTALDLARQADHCDRDQERQDGSVRHVDAQCAGGRAVSLITIADAGHQWPGANPERPLIASLLYLDPPSTALDATDALWCFFEKHSRD